MRVRTVFALLSISLTVGCGESGESVSGTASVGATAGDGSSGGEGTGTGEASASATTSGQTEAGTTSGQTETGTTDGQGSTTEAGTGSGEGTTGGEAGVSWHGDVREIIETQCLMCHESGGIGPVVLDSYEAAANLAPALALVTSNRSMPPWMLSDDCHPMHQPRKLSEAQIETIAAWAEAGAPDWLWSRGRSVQRMARRRRFPRSGTVVFFTFGP